MLFFFFFLFFFVEKHSLFKKQQQFVCVYFFLSLSLFLFLFSTNKTELYHRHSLIRRLTSIILSMIAGLCCLYTSNEFEPCHSFFFFFFRPKKRLVTRNHLSFRQKRKFLSIDLCICV